MGLGFHLVESLIRERKHRPLNGDVVLIGRQTVYFSPDEIWQLLQWHGLDLSEFDKATIEIDRSTIDRHAAGKDANGNDKDLITDAALFRLLGASRVVALDHSDYEGAEIVHNLTVPVPDNLKGCADLILDGSTLDNVCDPMTVITNYAEMLRPGGRLITTNVFSNHHEPYVMLPPLWYIDYFVTNNFADCKVYILTYPLPDSDPGEGSNDVFTFDLEALHERRVSSFTFPRMMAVIVLAEKAPDSTSHLRATQQQYRGEAEWESYREKLQRIRSHPRHHLVRTHGDISLFDLKHGHLFMANDFSARDPMAEIVRLRQQGS